MSKRILSKSPPTSMTTRGPTIGTRFPTSRLPTVRKSGLPYPAWLTTTSLYLNEGSRDQPEWKKILVVQPNGQPIVAPEDVWNAPRLSVADWDDDGKEDLIIGYESVNETVLPEIPQIGSVCD